MQKLITGGQANSGKPGKNGEKRGLSVNRDHDFAGFDYRIGMLARDKAKCGNRFFGDNGSDLLSSGKFDDNLGINAAGRDRFDRAFQDVSCTDLHGFHHREMWSVSISILRHARIFAQFFPC